MTLELTDQGEGSAQLKVVGSRNAENGLNSGYTVTLFKSQHVYWHAQATNLTKHLLQGLYNGALEEDGQHFDARRSVSGEFSGTKWI